MWWSFKNKNISTGRRHITLNIERATSTSAGVYTCSATNEFGSKEKTVIVEIRDNSQSPNYIPTVAAAVGLLVLIIALLIYAWKKKKSTGHYHILSVKEYEMRPLSNGGQC